MIRIIAGLVLLCGTCHGAREVTLANQGNVHLVVRLADRFDAANPAIVCEIRNMRPEPFMRSPSGPAEGFVLTLYGADGKELPLEKAWASRNDPQANENLLGRPPENLLPGEKLTGPSFSLAEIFGPKWSEGKRLRVEWYSGVSRLKQPETWWLQGSIDLRALANDLSLVAVETPDPALEKIDGAKPEEELFQLVTRRLKEQNARIPEGVKPLVRYKGMKVSFGWEWLDAETKRPCFVLVRIDRVSGEISDFVNTGAKR